ncbi:unnamed protein product [Cuscuta europaea]|uniref:Uncharacterized protein n=1 Tax=Cuscuta europaea TaxID=41803 RepID=A0A9P1DW28_CUSEU|nr:unnamed protein product [Cuscuta europaea]
MNSIESLSVSFLTEVDRLPGGCSCNTQRALKWMRLTLFAQFGFEEVDEAVIHSEWAGTWRVFSRTVRMQPLQKSAMFLTGFSRFIFLKIICNAPLRVKGNAT